jgi:hypothetical protein
MGVLPVAPLSRVVDWHPTWTAFKIKLLYSPKLLLVILENFTLKMKQHAAKRSILKKRSGVEIQMDPPFCSSLIALTRHQKGGTVTIHHRP